MAGSDDETGGNPGKSAVERIIEHHQLQIHEARSRVLQSSHVLAHVPREPRLRLQQAILDYYHALKPLRDRPEVEEWWSQVTLSENWVKDRTVETDVTVGGDPINGVEVTEEEREVVEYYEGLDVIPEEFTQTVTETVHEHGFSGPSTATKRTRKVMDAQTLIDVASTLDDAAVKLGFAPEGDTPETAPHDNRVDPRGETR